MKTSIIVGKSYRERRNHNRFRRVLNVTPSGLVTYILEDENNIVLSEQKEQYIRWFIRELI